MQGPGVPGDAAVAQLLFIFERNAARSSGTSASGRDEACLLFCGVRTASEAAVRRVLRLD
jgi:hypothetical protein